MFNNLFSRFLGFFAAMFSGLFTANPSSHKERLYERMMRNNAEAYAKSRNKLQRFADRFLIPVMDRDKKTGLLVHNKRSRRYDSWVKTRKTEIREKRGHRWYDVEGVEILALNMKNAIKRKERLGVYV